MDIEDELAELKAELDRSNEDPKVKRFVNSREYRILLKKESAKICEICGREYKITHLCETACKFEWSDLWKHYTVYEVSTKTTSKSPKPIPQKKIEAVKNVNPYYPKPTQPKKSSNNCGVCVCIIIIVVFLFIFLG